ncbi:hypothetical protein H7H51_24470 [Mycolicibacterium farcinogenes]|nr:hypothetical protein [Mycolicibacterium farcinogenes]
MTVSPNCMVVWAMGTEIAGVLVAWSVWSPRTTEAAAAAKPAVQRKWFHLRVDAHFARSFVSTLTIYVI